MGRKAKLKQQRKQQLANEPAASQTPTDDPQAFVSRLAEEGYSLERSLQAPPLPNHDPRPEL
jgi:hypothetical protein